MVTQLCWFILLEMHDIRSLFTPGHLGSRKQEEGACASMSPSMVHLQRILSLQLSTPLKETTAPEWCHWLRAKALARDSWDGGLQDLNYNRYQNQLKPRNQEQLKFASHKYNKRYIDFFF